MPKVLVEVMKDLERAKERRAVWDEVVEHLKSFIDTDVALAAAGIAVDRDSPRIVPQRVIAEVVESIIREKVAPIVDFIHSTEHWEIAERKNELDTNGGSKKSRQEKKAPEEKAGPAKKAGPVKKPGLRIGGPKPVRPPSKA
jgi:hypothetical protein